MERQKGRVEALGYPVLDEDVHWGRHSTWKRYIVLVSTWTRYRVIVSKTEASIFATAIASPQKIHANVDHSAI